MTESQREMNYSAGAWVHTDNSAALKNALNRIAEWSRKNDRERN